MSTHGIVYAEQGMYAGWPANHGAWQWGDEFLVGFLSGKYGQADMHRIVEPFGLGQARSMDGGETWATEPCAIAVDDMAAPYVDYPHGDIPVIFRVRGSYDHGGDFCHREGSYYASADRGRTWTGPHAFIGLEREFEEPLQCTARTRVIDGIVFLSRADANCWGSDDVFCAEFDCGQFRKIGDFPSDKGRTVMPAVARVGGALIATCRRRMTGRSGGWIDAYRSTDNGATWTNIVEVGKTGAYNGNPPALAVVGDVLICCYANRSDMQIIARKSGDGGDTWSLPIVLAEGKNSDIGYPQLFVRADGDLVCVYYWAKDKREHQHIAWTRFRP
jgi:hypothetical protein